MTVEIPDNLRRKLEEFRDQFDDIERQLMDPDVITDHRAVSRLSARRKALQPLVEGLKEFDVATGEVAEWQSTIATGEDAEMAAMGREELLFDSSDGPDAPAQGDLAGHSEVAPDRNAQKRRGHRGADCHTG